jgi:predicted nicotinamide N-methyase
LENIKSNVVKNKILSQNVQIIQLNWLEYQRTTFAQKFDIIIGSDIVYFGCPVVELYNMIKKALADNGIAQIIIPDRKNYAQLFLQQI